MQTGYRITIITPPTSNHANLDSYPILFFHEVIEYEITRVIEIWADGHTGIARSKDMLELGGSGVPDQLDPEVLDPALDLPELEISREYFERYWNNAVRRVEWELGIKVPG